METAKGLVVVTGLLFEFLLRFVIAGTASGGSAQPRCPPPGQREVL